MCSSFPFHFHSVILVYIYRFFQQFFFALDVLLPIWFWIFVSHSLFGRLSVSFMMLANSIYTRNTQVNKRTQHNFQCCNSISGFSVLLSFQFTAGYTHLLCYRRKRTHWRKRENECKAETYSLMALKLSHTLSHSLTIKLAKDNR